MCGSAWCLEQDFTRAWVLFPDADVIAVNGAAEHVPADHLYSQHPLKLPRWIARQTSRFGSKPLVHAGGRSHWRNKFGAEPETPWVDYRWTGVASKGTSGWGARRLAVALGYDRVVLCGIPMDPGGYQGGRVAKLNQKLHVMEDYRRHILADKTMHVGVQSMSGWTREQFGGPDEG